VNAETDSGVTVGSRICRRPADGEAEKKEKERQGAISTHGRTGEGKKGKEGGCKAHPGGERKRDRFKTTCISATFLMRRAG